MTNEKLLLTAEDHNRELAGLRYVYAVYSRRAGGVSLGINLNVNNACNWRCRYCQVPELKRGGPPPVDLAQLEAELRTLFAQVRLGSFVPANGDPAPARDLCFSGNGEPTTSPEFTAAVALAGRVRREEWPDQLPLVVISNGSQVHRPEVQEGLRELRRQEGELWFKLDGATDTALRSINGANSTIDRHLRRLRLAAALCPTWIQTCMFQEGAQPPDPRPWDRYIELLQSLKQTEVPVQGVLLYGLRRPPMLPESRQLAPVPLPWAESLAERVRGLGFNVRLSP